MKNSRLWLCAIVMVTISSCDQNPASVILRHNVEDQTRLQEFVTQIKSGQVFVEGGEYLVGDFGEEHGVERPQYDGRKDSKPLHRVELSSYLLNRLKISSQQYQFYLARNGLEGREVKGCISQQKWNEMERIPGTLVHVDWHKAGRYCVWLEEVTGLPSSLPMEAQREYAARNRGKYVATPTDDGMIRIEGQRGINVTITTDREMYACQSENLLDIAPPPSRDFRPPDPLRICDTTGSGQEWMKDWYDSEYYRHSPVKDSQGPGQPIFKNADGYHTWMLCGQDFSGLGCGLMMARYKVDLKSRLYRPGDKTVRCAINYPSPVK